MSVAFQLTGSGVPWDMVVSSRTGQAGSVVEAEMEGSETWLILSWYSISPFLLAILRKIAEPGGLEHMGPTTKLVYLNVLCYKMGRLQCLPCRC